MLGTAEGIFLSRIPLTLNNLYALHLSLWIHVYWTIYDALIFLTSKKKVCTPWKRFC